MGKTPVTAKKPSARRKGGDAAAKRSKKAVPEQVPGEECREGGHRGKTLVIAEKPSVAGDIARALGKFHKEKDYFENDEYVISSAIGHLVEIIPPEGVEKKGKWKLENLPVIPPHFDLKPIEKTEARYNVLKRLIHRKDVTALVNACDAGREGELIFRYIVKHAGCRKPVQRLWLQSMTPASIRENFKFLRTDEEMRPLADAAMCRSEADWLVGINGTRALTAFNSQGGGFHKTPVGRVQTPTLAVLVQREAEIKNFQSKPYWELVGVFGAEAGAYTGKWYDESFKKPEPTRDGRASDLRAERIWEEARALEIAGACRGRPGVVQEEKKPSQQAPPLLYDLTSLQREANSRFGFPARMTLGAAQALYEKHKVLTYPRTDSRYLPEDYPATVKGTLGALKSYPGLGQHAASILRNDWVRPGNKRVFNQAKVSDHFAIIPIAVPAHKLSDVEERIYELVMKRFLAVFFPPAVFEVTTRITRVEKHPFKTEGKVMIEPGWLAVYGREVATEEDSESEGRLLVAVRPGETVETRDVEVHAEATRPPARYTEATLLSAMEGAGKRIEDEDLREAMAEKGLGTPATRAQIIEGLIYDTYVRREGRELIPTPKAFNLMETLEVMKIPALSSPELTGGWEFKLKEVEHGKFTRDEFMKEIGDLTRNVVESVRGFHPEEVEARVIDLVDPFTREPMIETLKDYRSRDGTLVIRKAVAGRILDHDEVEVLLEKRVVGPLDGFRSRLGRPFSALVKLKEDKTVELDWGGNGESEGPNFDELQPLAQHPKGFPIYELPNAYQSKETKEDGKRPRWRVSRLLLDKEVPREQVLKLLSDGRTDLIQGFVSKKTRRPFKAFLVLTDEGVGFDFPPREPKGKGKPKAKTE